MTEPEQKKFDRSTFDRSTFDFPAFGATLAQVMSALRDAFMPVGRTLAAQWQQFVTVMREMHDADAKVFHEILKTDPDHTRCTFCNEDLQ